LQGVITFDCHDMRIALKSDARSQIAHLLFPDIHSCNIKNWITYVLLGGTECLFQQVLPYLDGHVVGIEESKYEPAARAIQLSSKHQSTFEH
jgi:hypothetical protein